jgi:hypothetical protein
MDCLALPSISGRVGSAHERFDWPNSSNLQHVGIGKAVEGTADDLDGFPI